METAVLTRSSNLNLLRGLDFFAKPLESYPRFEVNFRALHIFHARMVER